MIFLLIFIAGMAAGGYGAYDYMDGKTARRERALEQAQKKIDEQGAQAVKAANDEIAKMQLAYEAGQAKAKIKIQTVYAQGDTYVKNTPSLRSPVCVIGPAGVSALASQTSDLQLAAAASVLGLSVSGAIYPQGGNDDGRGTVSAASGQPGPVARLPVQVQQLRPADEGAGAAALGLHRPNKPVPVQ